VDRLDRLTQRLVEDLDRQQTAKVRVIGALDAADSRGWIEFHTQPRSLKRALRRSRSRAI